MTKKEKDTLIILLKKLKDENLLIPNIPSNIWYAINSILPLPAVEVLITSNGKDFLLTNRKDKYWNGWHIPGGFLMYRETLEQACKRVAEREIGVPAIFKKLLLTYVWLDHPYAGSLSLVCHCIVKSKPKKGRFFTNIPPDIISHHSEFIKEFLKNDSDEGIYK